MTWIRAWMQTRAYNSWLLPSTRAAENPKCFVGTDIDSFKII